MQKVNTFDTAFDAHKTAHNRAADVTGLGWAIRDAWARLLEFPIADYAVEAMQEADESQVADDGILANYYDGAHERVSAAEPLASIRKLAP